MEGEADRRAIWFPTMIIDKTKEVENAKFSVFRGTWPKDNTELSQKTLDIYFDEKNTFFFPFWIQIYTGHINVIFRVVDSGKNIIPSEL